MGAMGAVTGLMGSGSPVAAGFGGATGAGVAVVSAAAYFCKPFCRLLRTLGIIGILRLWLADCDHIFFAVVRAEFKYA